MPRISIATERDVEDLSQLVAILMEQEEEFIPNKEVHKKGVSAIINNPDKGMILKLSNDGRIIGMIGILYSISTAIGARVAIFEDFVIRPGYRNRGWGRVLFEAAVKEAQKNGCKRITLLTDHDNENAHRFYTDQGMESSSMVPFRKMLD